MSVRVVSATNDLVAVFSGTLGPCANEKSPSLFWPIEVADHPAELERPGIYVHPEVLEDVHVHVGGFVVAFLQAGATVNVRRLEPASS